MYKLLPDWERQKVENEYSLRRAVVMLRALIVVLVVGIVGLLPSYLLSNARKLEVSERIKITGEMGLNGGSLDSAEWLKELNLKLEVLAPGLDKDRPSAIVEEVIETRTSGVRLTDFSWSKDKEKNVLSVSGIALDRQSLLAFQNQLNASGAFSEVVLPVSNLAKDRDIPFQLKLTPTQKK